MLHVIASQDEVQVVIKTERLTADFSARISSKEIFQGLIFWRVTCLSNHLTRGWATKLIPASLTKY